MPNNANVAQVNLNSAVTHELAALLDDRRLMLSNSESFIAGRGPYKHEVQSKLSKRKKEIRSGLKVEWMTINQTKTSQMFDAWLAAKIVEFFKLH